MSVGRHVLTVYAHLQWSACRRNTTTETLNAKHTSLATYPHGTENVTRSSQCENTCSSWVVESFVVKSKDVFQLTLSCGRFFLDQKKNTSFPITSLFTQVTQRLDWSPLAQPCKGTEPLETRYNDVSFKRGMSRLDLHINVQDVLRFGLPICQLPVMVDLVEIISRAAAWWSSVLGGLPCHFRLSPVRVGHTLRLTFQAEVELKMKKFEDMTPYELCVKCFWMIVHSDT